GGGRRSASVCRRNAPRDRAVAERVVLARCRPAAPGHLLPAGGVSRSPASGGSRRAIAFFQRVSSAGRLLPGVAGAGRAPCPNVKRSADTQRTERPDRGLAPGAHHLSQAARSRPGTDELGAQRSRAAERGRRWPREPAPHPAVRSAHWPSAGPRTSLSPPVGSSSLPEHESGPLIVFPVRVTAPVTDVMSTGPLIVLSVSETSAAPWMRSGPLRSESASTSPAPSETETGPRMSASVMQVVPSSIVSGPRCEPLISSSHCELLG